MTIYGGPNRRVRDGYTAVFVRAGNFVSVGKPNDTSVTHRDLAQSDEIDPFVERLKISNPNEVDAGVIRVTHDRAGGGEIVVLGISASYDLPVLRSNGRLRTGEIIAKLSPRYEVTTDSPRVSGGKERR